MVKGRNKTGWIKPIIALVVPCVYLVVILMTSVISYITEDDVPMMQFIAGYTTGVATGWARFINPVLFKTIAFFYSLIPGIDWYAVIQLFIIVLSMGIINYSAIKQMDPPKWKVFIDIILAILIDSVLYWIIIRMHMYFVSAIAGCAAIAVVITSDFRNNRVNTYAVVIICFLLGYLWSAETAKSFSCFLGLSLLYRACLDVVSIEDRGERKKGIKRIALVPLIIAGTMAVIFVAGGELAKRESIRTNGHDYREYDEYRITFQDYGLPEFDSNQEIYNAEGWDRDYYTLVRNFYYLDERVDTVHVKNLVDKYAAPSLLSPLKKTEEGNKNIGTQDESQSTSGMFDEGISRFRGLLEQEREAKALYVWMWGLVLASILLVTKEKKQIIRVTATVLCFCGAMALTLILSQRGRIPLRGFAVVAIPSLVFMVINLVEILKHKIDSITQTQKGNKRIKERIQEKQFWKNAITCFLTASILLYSYYVYSENNFAELTANNIYKEEIERENRVYQYALDHRDTTFVCDWPSYKAHNPFSNIKAGELTNLITTGGWRYNSYGYRIQMAINGLDKLTSENLADEDIYYISSKKYMINHLIPFLRNNYKIDQCKIVDQFDEFYVLKFYSSERNYSEDFLSEMKSYQSY